MYKIIEANLSFIDNIYELEQALFKSGAYSLKTLKEELTNEHRIYLLALDNENKVIGYIGASFIGETADVMKIAVEPYHQKKGIATKLFENLLTKLKENKINTIMLEVNEANNSAISLYKKLGFYEINTRNHYYSTGESAHILKLEI